jgi:hypothetical protein
LQRQRTAAAPAAAEQGPKVASARQLEVMRTRQLEQPVVLVAAALLLMATPSQPRQAKLEVPPAAPACW